MRLQAAKCACALMMLMSLVAMGRGQEKKDPPQTEAKKVQDEAKPVAPVIVDAGFQESLADYQMILREIERIENATGSLEIAVSVVQLRQRAEVKLLHLKAWMKDHQVGDDWAYDAGAKAFRAPQSQPAAQPAAAAKPEGKK